jgi:hypothetical protein
MTINEKDEVKLLEVSNEEKPKEIEKSDHYNIYQSGTS